MPSSLSSLPNLNKWMTRYEAELVKDRALRPGKYLWEDSRLKEVCDRMRESFAKGPGHYNKDSHTIRATCKYFGIAMTYTSIDRFIKGQK